jgi:hypothetical protein
MAAHAECCGPPASSRDAPEGSLLPSLYALEDYGSRTTAREDYENSSFPLIKKGSNVGSINTCSFVASFIGTGF